MVVGIRVDMLGSFRVRSGETILRIPGQRPSTLIASLALSAGRTVSVQTLADCVWGERLPESATSSLHSLVARLRQAIGPDVIRTMSTGYLVDIEPDQVDLLRFRRLVDEATQVEDGEKERRLLAEALQLWRGEPLVGLTSELLRRDIVPALVEEHLTVVERRISLDLAAGKHDELIGELRELVGRHRLRETLWHRLITAQDNAGRRAEALDTYHRLRTELREHFGIEPAAELRQLYQSLLVDVPVPAPESTSAQDPNLPVPVRGEASAVVPAAERTLSAMAGEESVSALVPTHSEDSTRDVRGLRRPAQLPADVVDFAGRDKESAELVEVCSRSGAGPGRVPVAVVIGGGGLGKTTLAVHTAHRVAHLFPDGQLYVDLRGADPSPRDPSDVLASFLKSLGLPDGDLPQGEDDRAACYRTAMSGRRVLVVLDNARETAQIRPLMPAADGCAVLATSRNTLSGLAGAYRLDLDLLPARDALKLFTGLVGAERAAAEPDAVAAIVGDCAGLPLALRIAGARLAERPAWSVEAFAARLADRRRRLDELAVSDLAVRASFETSHALLAPSFAPGSGESANPARVFRIAAMIPASTFDADEVTALLGDQHADVESALERLVDVQLLTALDRGRYRFHDLIREYALECLEHAEPAAERDQALRRLITWYADSSEAATGAIGRANGLLPPGDIEPGTPAPPQFPDQESAAAWCARHFEALFAAVEAASGCGRPDLAPRIAVYMFAYAAIDMTVNYDNCLERALAVARDQQDQAAEAWVLHRMGVWHGMWERNDQCVSVLGQALAAHREVGDHAGELLALANLASGYNQLGQLRRALECGRQALAGYTLRPTPILRCFEPQLHAGIALAYLGLDEYQLTVDHASRALALRQPADQSRDRATTLNALAAGYRGLGRFDEAVGALKESLSLSIRSNDCFGQADALYELGVVFQHFDRMDEARGCFTQSLELFEHIGFNPGIDRATGSLAELAS